MRVNIYAEEMAKWREVSECEFVGGCREAASFLAVPVSTTHDFDSKFTCVRRLGGVIKYEDDEAVQRWEVEVWG